MQKNTFFSFFTKMEDSNFEDPLNEITIINNVVREVEKSDKK